MKKILLLTLAISINFIGKSQCADNNNVYSFTYMGHAYHVVKENKTWTEAANCAVERGGYLAEINDSLEQDTIFFELTNNSGINFTNTQNIFGTSSIWIGGTDSIEEGKWIWNGDNDTSGVAFWDGAANGNPVNNAYTNWGISPAEPDNSGGQDRLTIIVDNSKVNYGMWNDLKSNDNLYYLIEYDGFFDSKEEIELENVNVYPNPTNGLVTISLGQKMPDNIKVEIVNSLGQVLINEIKSDENISYDLSSYPIGMYFVRITSKSGVINKPVLLNH